MGTPCQKPGSAHPKRPHTRHGDSPQDHKGRTAYTYDAWGRTTSKTRVVDASTTYTASYVYRFGDKLHNYSTNFPGERDAAYIYDGLGKRRWRVVDGNEATWWRWDAGFNILAEYDGGENPNNWDPGAVVKTYVPGLGEFDAGGDYAYYLQDHLGSTRNVLDGAKAMLAKLEYTPYGQEYQFGGNVPSPRFTGHHWDAETGMYFAPFRYYMPGSGRWLTKDPLGMVDGPNVYGYVGGSPIGRVDPLGLCCEAEHANMISRCTLAMVAAAACVGASAKCAVCMGTCIGVPGPWCSLLIFKCAALCSAAGVACASAAMRAVQCGAAAAAYLECRKNNPKCGDPDFVLCTIH